MVTLVAGAVLLRYPFQRIRHDLVTHAVRYERLELTITERGTLESRDNNDVYCRVKAGAKNSTIATTIKWIIDDGSQVKQGDLLVDLDDSGLQEQLKTQKITLDRAEAEKIQAEENHKIVKSQNESDIKTAEVNLDLARIDLQKYLEGDFPQMLNDVEGRIKVAESDSEMQRDRVAWANRMVKKGYLTANQAQAEQSRLDSYDLTLRKFLDEKRVLTDPNYGTRKRTETDLLNKVKEAERALKRIQGQALAKEVQARTDREAKKSIHEQESTRYKEVQEEIKKCKIVSPEDGMVVYYMTEQSRYSSGSQQSIIAQGEPVREGQKLMRIPDLKRMLVNTKVHEAMVSRVQPGQPVAIRTDAFPSRKLHGSVHQVATVSSQTDWMSSDVKVYQTMVSIDEAIEGLKPGMSAEVAITVGDPLERVLTVPIQAIVGGPELGPRRRCFVLTASGPEEREIVVGLSNEKMAEIKEGLREGEEVVLNPKSLVGDRIRTRQAGAPSAGGNEGFGDGGKGARTEGGSPAKGRLPAGTENIPEKSKEGKGKSGAQKSPEERARFQQELADRYRKASPDERKQMLEKTPTEYRAKVKETLKAQGIEVPE